MSKNTAHAPHMEHAQAFGNAVGEIWKSMQGLSLPLPALNTLQAEYLKEATALWNGAIERAPGDKQASRAVARRSPLRRQRLGQQPDRGVDRADLPAQRAHADEAGRGRRGRCQDQGAHPLRGAAVDRRRQPEQLPGAQPRGAAQGARDQGREHRPGPEAPVAGHPAGPCVADRRERVRGRPQRGHQRGCRGVRERTVPAARVQAADGQGARAADAVRAAVHQQVLHPRPAARRTR